jgi:hypothetical protein
MFTLFGQSINHPKFISTQHAMATLMSQACERCWRRKQKVHSSRIIMSHVNDDSVLATSRVSSAEQRRKNVFVEVKAPSSTVSIPEVTVTWKH